MRLHVCMLVVLATAAAMATADDPILEEEEGDVDFGDAADMADYEAPPNMVDDEEEQGEEGVVEPLDYATPQPNGDVHFVEPFAEASLLGRRWIVSQATKDGVEDSLAKYDGEWQIGLPDTVLLKDDLGLIIKTKARHHAISAKLDRPFTFDGKPLVVQYEVKFQNGQECGGAYIKLLSRSADLNLKKFTDKTPYSIMFGPDKCGLSSKLHFIVKFENPKNGSVNEHHAKQPSKSLDEFFNDKKSHLFTLVVTPDNEYMVYVDQSQVVKGHLLKDLEPPITPPKEMEDPDDSKPADWDEREKIVDPDAAKPDDWDELAPEMVDDADAEQPADWLVDEAEYVDDDAAVKPDDWDDEMDGQWEPAKIKNPKCEGVSGCGVWTRPQTKNPEYKGKWKAPKIDNPNFKGKWKPRIIENPFYFEAEQPYKMTPIAAVGLELWTMSDGILFDNFLVTDSKEQADEFAAITWQLKKQQESVVARSKAGKGVFGSLLAATSERPWLWAVLVLALLIPIVLLTIFCFGGSKDKRGEAKKTDETQPDDDDVLDDDDDDAKASDEAAGDAPNRRSRSADDAPAAAAASKEQLEDDEDEEEETVEEEAKPKPSPRLRQRKQD